MARVLATLYPAIKEAGADYDVATQQLIYYMLKTEEKLSKERKKRSVPGAIEVPTALFTQDVLTTDQKTWQ